MIEKGSCIIIYTQSKAILNVSQTFKIIIKKKKKKTAACLPQPACYFNNPNDSKG